MTSTRRPRRRLAALLLAVVASACTVDDPQVSNVGAVTLFLVDPSLGPQVITVSAGSQVDGNHVQAMFWSLTEATLTVNGADHDLLFTPEGEAPDCRLADTPFASTVSRGNCLRFLVLESFEETDAVEAQLKLTFDVRLKRLEPPAYPLIGDVDGDGILNGNDNCVLIPNPGQEDTGGRGFGNACRIYGLAGAQRDSDADGVADSVDNCVQVANAIQANPPADEYTELESIVSDGIGLACESDEQIIDLTGTTMLTFDFVLPRTQGFVVLDFDDERVFANCDWTGGTCPAGWESQIIGCIETSPSAATLGCS